MHILKIVLIFNLNSFGTFVPESEPEVYGLVHHVASFNPFITLTHTFYELYQKLMESDNIVKKILGIVMPPAYIPQTNEWFARVPVDTETIYKFNPIITSYNYYYACVQFCLISSVSILVLMTRNNLVELIVYGIVSCITLGSLGYIFDNEASVKFEIARLCIVLFLLIQEEALVMQVYWYASFISILAAIKLNS